MGVEEWGGWRVSDCRKVSKSNEADIGGNEVVSLLRAVVDRASARVGDVGRVQVGSEWTEGR
jgi:hypothetical protein